MQTFKLQGTDKQLYQLVGPLVMDPKVLQYNQGYPFKTGEQFIWYLAVENNEVAGFLPLDMRKKEHVINNYYAAAEKHNEIIEVLLDAVIADEEESMLPLTAVVQTPHRALFEHKGFEIMKSWKLYIKMQRYNNGKSCSESEKCL